MKERDTYQAVLLKETESVDRLSYWIQYIIKSYGCYSLENEGFPGVAAE